MWWKRLIVPVNYRSATAFVPMRIRGFDLAGSGGGAIAVNKKSYSSSVPVVASSTNHREFSQRGLDAVELLPIYLADARKVERYCPKTCPEGALQLSVAENQMLENVLVPALSKFSSRAPAFEASLIYYQPTQGRLEFRQAMANYLQRTLKLNKLNVDGLVVGAGCNAVLENLCFCLASHGDAVLIPTPYYAAFEFDLVARAGLSIQPVTTFDHHSGIEISSSLPVPAEAYYPNKSSLDAAFEKSRNAGHEPRVLLLSHPNNPLGISYPPHVIQECIDWCREREVHLVSDEIYAGSVYRNKGDSFTSTLKLASQETPTGEEGLGLGPYIHLVYALSKDFALSGLRVGACYTENQSILLPMQKLNDLCQISSQTQTLVERMLDTREGDEYWTDATLRQSHDLIRTRCDELQSCLKECGIPYLQADSGLFVWMDFREFLPKNDSNDIQAMERALYLELMNDFGLLFTPGLSMKNEFAGFFRCVFTAATDDEFELGIERVRKFVAAKRNLS